MELLETAETAWRELGRPLEAARCRLMAGQRLVGPTPTAPRELLEAAAEEAERLGVPHLARGARALRPAG